MPYFYDVHALLTIASDVPLRELAAFARPAADSNPCIRIRARSGARQPRQDASEGAIEIEASLLLRHSPHSLYTTLVEPVLRWAFVRKGWALVHGACFADGDDAYLISAPSDTGKTRTLLTLLRRYPQLAFLADDLCLVGADGSVLDFPKPMTISRHTLPAVNAHVLSVRERAALAVQSRVHSRSGRRFSQLLGRAGLSMATVTAVVERMVPPPSFSIERLLPHARASHGARLRGLFLIERGAVETTRELDHETAMKKLHANCDDGFCSPAFGALATRLSHQGGCDWREQERTILDAAFAGQSATLLESSRSEWWRPIASGIGQPSARPRPVASARPPRAAVAAASAR